MNNADHDKACDSWKIVQCNNREWRCTNKPDGIVGWGINPTAAYHDCMAKTLKAEGASEAEIKKLLATEYKNG